MYDIIFSYLLVSIIVVLRCSHFGNESLIRKRERIDETIIILCLDSNIIVVLETDTKTFLVLRFLKIAS